MARIYRRGKSWGIDYQNASGKRIRQIVGDKATAQKELAQALAGWEKPKCENILINELCREYIGYLEGRKEVTGYYNCQYKKRLNAVRAIQKA